MPSSMAISVEACDEAVEGMASPSLPVFEEEVLELREDRHESRWRRCRIIQRYLSSVGGRSSPVGDDCIARESSGCPRLWRVECCPTVAVSAG